jgi:hypothetical protein
MKKLLLICVVVMAFAFVASATYGQTTSPTDGSAGARPKQEQLIGAVAAIDAATGQVTVKTDAGKTVSVSTGDQTAYLRIAPGEKTLSNAAKIARTDVAVGDRVLVRAGAAATAEGQPVMARQVIVISKDALAARDERVRQDASRRGINGRITAVNPQTKEITIAARTRDAMDTVIINASAVGVRLLRYAPDSIRREDAQPASFADLKVGDQLRAIGDRSGDGTHFTPEEIVAGSFARTSGTIVSTDTAKNEVTIKDDQGKTFTIAVSARSVLHRLPADFEERLAKLREEAQQRRAAAAAAAGGTGGSAAAPNGQPGEGSNVRTGSSQDSANGGQQRGQRRGGGFGGGPGGGPGGGGFQRLFEGMPAVTVADLKKGDMVSVNGTPSAADPSHLTAITLTTGDAALMRRLQQFGRPGGGDRNMSPGLPGSVVGTGSGGERDRP